MGTDGVGQSSVQVRRGGHIVKSVVEDSSHPDFAGCGDAKSVGKSGFNSLNSMATALGPVDTGPHVNSVKIDCDPVLAGLQPIKNEGDVQQDRLIRIVLGQNWQNYMREGYQPSLCQAMLIRFFLGQDW